MALELHRMGFSNGHHTAGVAYHVVDCGIVVGRVHEDNDRQWLWTIYGVHKDAAGGFARSLEDARDKLNRAWES